MNKFDLNKLKPFFDKLHDKRRIILCLSVLVVFMTTYLLVLPAFTLDKEEAAEKGGIDVPAAEQMSGEDVQPDVGSDDESKNDNDKSDTETTDDDQSVANTESSPDKTDDDKPITNKKSSSDKTDKTDTTDKTDDSASADTEDESKGDWKEQYLVSRKSKGWLGFKKSTRNNDGLGEPEANKTLAPNNDGTYTLTLSVKAPSSSSSSSSKANVVIIYDSSNSMHEPVDGNTWVRDDEHGTYAEYNGKYYQLASFGSSIRKIFSFKDDDGVTHTLGADQPNSGIFCGPKYRPTKTRMDVARNCVKTLGQQLLENNSSETDDTVEVAFVEFASDVTQQTSKTTSLSVFNSWVNNCKTAVEQTQNGGDLRGGTNWDKALKKADEIDFNDDDPVYIVFISDGNPTARTTPDGLISGSPDDDSGEYDDGPRIGSTGLFGGVIPEVYGTGIDDIKEYNYKAALKRAREVSQHNKTLYNIGIFGDADKMSGLVPNAGYFDGTDEESIRNAFSDIVSSISSQVGYTDVQVTDGLTSMTSTAIVGHGRASDFTFRKNGQIVETQESWMNISFDDPVNDPAHNQYESGRIHWNLGSDYILEDGVEYSVSFIVWPNQHSYNLVADLNNGTVSFSELTNEEKSQFEFKNGKYVLKTNTVANATFKRTDSGATTDLPLAPPDPMPLDESKITVQKVWSDSLSPAEYEEIMENNDFHVKLNLMIKENETSRDYLEKAVEISKPENHLDRVWPENDPDGHHISVGLMVSETSAKATGLYGSISNGEYPTCTYDDETYYILDEGYDYYFVEHVDSQTDYHFELENKIIHPMVVDGVEKDVTFSTDGSGNKIVTDAVNLTTLTATNSLKGGINLKKIIVDADGNQIEDNSTSFTIHGSFTPGTRLEYRKIGPEYTDENGESGRSEKFYIEEAQSNSFDITLFGGDSIRFVNVPSGQEYSFYEELPDGSKYVLASATGEIKFKNADGTYDESKTESMTVTGEGNDKTVSSTSRTNAEQNVTFTNCKQVGTIDLTKKVTLDGSPTSTDKADGDYYFTILDSNDQPAEGKLDGISIVNGQVKITITGGQASTIHITDVPVGTYHIVETAPNNGTSLSGIEPDDAPNIDLDSGSSGDVVIESDETATVAFTNDRSSLTVDDYIDQTITKEWYRDGQQITGSDIANKTIKYRITQKRAIVDGNDAIYPVVIKLINYDDSTFATKTYFVKKHAFPYVTAWKTDSSNATATATRYSGNYTKTQTKYPDANDNRLRYYFTELGSISRETLIVIKPSSPSVQWDRVELTSDYMADSPEQYISELDNTGLEYEDHDFADVELSAKSETAMFELGGVTYGAESENWTATINSLPLYKRDGENFYVYKYVIEEIEIDGEPVDSSHYDVETISNGNSVTFKNSVSEDAPELPSTGGIGTTIFYIIGSILVLACSVILISRGRMRKG